MRTAPPAIPVGKRAPAWRPGLRATARATTHELPWDLLLICVAVYLATAVGRLHQLFPVLLSLKPVLISAGLAVALYFGDQSRPRRLALVLAPTTTFMFLLLVWMALSVPGALHQGRAFTLLTDNFIKTVILYVLIVGCVRSFRDVERLATVYFSAVVVFALVVITRFDVGGSDWRLANLYFYDANDFATLAVTAMPLGFYLMVSPGTIQRRALGALGLLPLLVGFVWSGSRGGFLALLAMMAFMLFRYTAVGAGRRALSAVVVAVMLAATASDRYWTQMTTILNNDDDYNRTTEYGRMKIWRRGITYMVKHPVFGVGAENFPVAEGTISPLASRQEYNIGVRWGAAHNSYVQIGAELGVPGLLFMLAAIGSAFLMLNRVARRRPGPSVQQRGPPQLAQALASSLVGFISGAFFLSLAYSEMLYVLIALAAALAKTASLAGRPPHQATAGRLSTSR